MEACGKRTARWAVLSQSREMMGWAAENHRAQELLTEDEKESPQKSSPLAALGQSSLDYISRRLATIARFAHDACWKTAHAICLNAE